MTILLLSIYILFSIVYLLAGSLHLDEGAYLYASQAVYNGQMPYRDFFFLQPPLHPYIYGLIQLIVPGLLTARLTSILFGLCTTFLLSRLANKLGDSGTALINLALITLAPFQLYFFTIARLYALAAFFISLGLFLIFTRQQTGVIRRSAGMTALACAVAIRLTAAPIICLAGLYVLVTGKDIKARILPLIAGFFVLAAVYFPFIQATGMERFSFNVIGMNLSLHSDNVEANMIQKVRATIQLIRFYFPVWLLILPLVFQYFRTSGTRSRREIVASWLKPEGALWIICLVMLAVHSSAQLYQVSYQTIIMPVLICLTAVAWRRRYLQASLETRRLYAAGIIALWFMGVLAYGRTSISIVNGKPAMFALWEQARFVRQHTEPGDMLFTADSALVAAESGRKVLKGMAGSDLFADWPTDKCREYHVLNFDLISDSIKNREGALLMVGDLSFHVSLPSLEPVPDSRNQKIRHLIEQEYELLATYPNLLLPGTNTYYYKPLVASAEAPDKLLLFGIDAVGWNVLLPQIQSGELPNFKRAMDTGIAARMKTLEPTVSVMLWTTIATGMLPENHGINNWLMESADSSGQQAITSDRRKVPAFWNLTGRRTAGIVNWWATWPVEPVNGVMISNRAHFPGMAESIYPESDRTLMETVPFTEPSAIEAELSSLNPYGNPIRLPPFFAEQLRKDRYYLDLAQQILLEKKVDILAVFVRGIDILQHEYLRDVRQDVASIPQVPEEQRGIVRAYYRYLDSRLGKFLEIMGPDTGLLIVSDHGMDPVITLPPLVEGMNIDRLLSSLHELSPELMPAGRFSDNQAYPPGLLRGLRWSGSSPVPEDEVERIMNVMKSLLVRTDTPLFDEVVTGSTPDELIRLRLNPSPVMDDVISWRSHSIPIMKVTDMIIHPRSGQHWHSPDGIFLASGPGIKTSPGEISEIGIVDIMPTLLAWIGLPVSKQLDGKPRLNFFSENHRKALPVQWVDAYESRPAHRSVEAPAEVDDALRKELESLGYIRMNQSPP